MQGKVSGLLQLDLVRGVIMLVLPGKPCIQDKNVLEKEPELSFGFAVITSLA